MAADGDLLAKEWEPSRQSDVIRNDGISGKGDLDRRNIATRIRVDTVQIKLRCAGDRRLDDIQFTTGAEREIVGGAGKGILRGEEDAVIGKGQAGGRREIALDI